MLYSYSCTKGDLVRNESPFHKDLGALCGGWHRLGARSLLCAGLVLTPSDIRWRPDRSSTVASLRCHPCTGQYLAPHWTSAWLFLSSYDRGCCSGHPCTDIFHTRAWSVWREIPVGGVCWVRGYMYLCLYPYQQIDL